MRRQGFVTWVEFQKHKRGGWRTDHGIWKHIRNYVPGWGYSKSAINAFFEGESANKKQVDWARITSKPSTFPPSPHSHDYGTW